MTKKITYALTDLESGSENDNKALKMELTTHCPSEGGFFL